IHLQRIFSGFPDGIRGIALLGLRSAAAFLLIRDSVSGWVGDSHPVALVVSGTAGAFLTAGVVTPGVCLVAALLELWEAARHGWPAWPLSFLLAAVLIALAALGPGAFSVDGWLFGRKK